MSFWRFIRCDAPLRIRPIPPILLLVGPARGDSDDADTKQHFHAGVAQLVEHNVANVVVVSSNLITRSFLPAEQQPKMTSVVFLYLTVGTSKEPVFY